MTIATSTINAPSTPAPARRKSSVRTESPTNHRTKSVSRSRSIHDDEYSADRPNPIATRNAASAIATDFADGKKARSTKKSDDAKSPSAALIVTNEDPVRTAHTSVDAATNATIASPIATERRSASVRFVIERAAIHPIVPRNTDTQARARLRAIL